LSSAPQPTKGDIFDILTAVQLRLENAKAPSKKDLEQAEAQRKKDAEKAEARRKVYSEKTEAQRKDQPDAREQICIDVRKVFSRVAYVLR
jgi:hypothetical protein